MGEVESGWSALVRALGGVSECVRTWFLELSNVF